MLYNFCFKNLVVFLALSCATQLSAMDKQLDYKIETKTVEAQPTLVVTDKVQAQNAGTAISAAISKVAVFLEKNKLHPVGDPFTRTFKFENGILEFESGFPMALKTPGSDDVTSSSLPKANVAFTTHVGSQETTEEAYKALHLWMKKEGKLPAGAPWEVYVDDPAKTAAEKCRTVIYFPIK